MKRAAALLLAVACSPSAPTASPSPLPSTLSPTRPAVSPSATPSPATLPTAFGGDSVRWPVTTDDAPPPALGAVVTLRVARTSTGTTLAAGLTLPRIGGTAAD